MAHNFKDIVLYLYGSFHVLGSALTFSTHIGVKYVPKQTVLPHTTCVCTLVKKTVIGERTDGTRKQMFYAVEEITTSWKCGLQHYEAASINLQE